MSAVRLRRSLIAAGVLALLLSFCVDLAMLVVPIYDMQLYDRVLESRNMDTMAMLSIACLVGLLFYAAFEYLRSLCFVAVGSLVGSRLYRLSLAEGLRLAAAGDRRTGPQLARDISDIRSFLASGAVAVPLDTLCTTLFVAVLFILNPAFGYLALAGISGLILFGIVAEHVVHPRQKAAQQARRDADYTLARSLSDADMVEGLGMLPAIARRWLGRYERVLDGLGEAAARTHWVSGASRTYRLGLQAAVMFVGAVLVVHGKTTPGALMGANLLLNKTLNPFDHLVGSARTWLEALDSWARVLRLLRARPPSEARRLPREVGPGLAVIGVAISAGDGRKLLTGVEFDLAPGTLALVSGPNGSGKTSLLRALAGLVQTTEGVVLLDGRPVGEAGGVGYLPQTVDLLEGDIALNVARMRRDLAGAIEATRRAGLHEVIGRMPRGYETQLSGETRSLSGGMRQRIGLARALYGAPRLLLLDEPDASLDTNGSAALLEGVRSACREGAVALVISHRETFRQAADVILQVQDGTVAVRPINPATRPARQLESA